MIKAKKIHIGTWWGIKMIDNKKMIKGDKKDSRKLEWSLLPLISVIEVVKVLQYGKKKYSVDNWKYVPDPITRYYNACTRHINAFMLGKKKDSQSKRHHIAHAICCLLFILWFELTSHKKGGVK